MELRFSDDVALGVVLAAGGYPGSYAQGEVIRGLDAVPEDVKVFHAGTAMEGRRVVTAGGRVLGITAIGDDLAAATKRAYDAVAKISFDGAFYRKDIGSTPQESSAAANDGS